jgi:glucose dehydrogenase
MSRLVYWLLGLAVAATASQAQAQQLDWPAYGGRADQSKFFDYAQLTPANVSKLKVAWTYRVTDKNAYQFQPLIVGSVMYVLAKDNSLVALDAATGKERWAKPGFAGLSRRGIVYWHTTRGEDSRLLITRNDRLLALDARTGKRLWHFQAVHHDLWDYDLTAAPQLLNITRDGKTIPAVAQATKQGFLFVFDRVTGEPLWNPSNQWQQPGNQQPR